LHLVNSYDTVIITSDPGFSKPPASEAFHPLSIRKPFRNNFFSVSVSKRGSKHKLHIRKPKENVYIRYRQTGDRVHPVGMEGTKKLQDIFVDAKIPRHLRDSWPVVVNQKNEIVWVPQLVVDRRFSQKPTEQEYVTFEVL
jgi:tRNA(Ile)-lysidine synthetase-like protein